MSNQLVRRGDKFDKYRAHILEGRKLKPDDLAQLARYRKAVAMLSLGYSRLNVVTAMKSDPNDPVSESQGYVIVKEAMKLYGSIDEVDKEGQRYIAYENYKMLAQLAKKEGNYAAAIRAQENADKLYDLFNAYVVKQDPSLFLVPVAIAFTTDVDVLHESQKSLEQGEDVEDTDFEEVDGDE